jgi:acid phosphatase type 7
VQIWDLWGIQSEPIAATRPFMTTPGNHESFYDWTAFTNRYKMPSEKSGGNGNFWFSYDYGNVHIVSVSTEHCFDAGCDQMVWVESDLKAAAANRNSVPWIVLSMHRPMYCSEDGSSIDNQFRVAMEPLMLQYDVDLVVQGHMHAYERIHPVDNGKVTVHPTHREAGEVDVYHAEGHGPVYVVQGNTGAMQFERWQHPKPQWSAIRFANGFIPPFDIRSEHGANSLEGLILDSNYTDTFGLGVADFVNSTHLHYTNIPVSGSIGTDEFWVVKRSRK